MIFREEALAHYARGEEDGSVLRIDSFWSDVVFLVLGGVFLCGLLVAIVLPLHRYASGPVVIRASSRVELTATETGTIVAVHVQPGQVVSSGQVLIELDSNSQKQELARYEQEIEQHQVRLLRNPADSQARAALPSLRAQRELLAARLESRTVRSDRAGQILDLHLRVGQRLSPGEVAVSLSAQDSFELLALLPGYARPSIHPGTPLRIELEGFRYLYLDTAVRSVSTEVLGPEAARRALGLQVADSLAIDGPVTLLRASLPNQYFRYDGERLHYFDGMRGRAEVKTRTERALLAFVPGLREVYRRVLRR